MDKTIPFLFIFVIVVNVVYLQEIKKICYDKDSDKPVELECKYDTTFFKKGSDVLTLAQANPDRYELIRNQTSDLKTLKIKKTDKTDDGSGAYEAVDVDDKTKRICIFNMLRSNDKSKHKGEFKLGNLASVQLLPGFTQTDIPKITVTGPNEFSIDVDYKLEALPLKAVTITLNDKTQVETSDKKCKTSNDNEVDCVEYNGQIKINNKCPNNRIELGLSYTLDDRLQCGLEVLPSFKYEFDIEYAPTQFSLTCNLPPSDTGVGYKAKRGDVAEFTETVACANPSKIKYNRKTVTQYPDRSNKTVPLVESEDNKFNFTFEEEFETMEVESCSSNGIGEPKCVRVSIEFYTGTSKPPICMSNGTLIGIVVGSFAGHILITAVCLLILYKRKKSLPTSKQNIPVAETGFYNVPEEIEPSHYYKGLNK